MNEHTIWVEAYIGLGSNLNDPAHQIRSAADEIGELTKVKTIALSPLYRSAPVGPQDQPDYINAVLRIKTVLSAHELLNQLQLIENQHGRLRTVRWGARTLDLDILLYGEEIIAETDLIVPHPELVNRAFALVPLADVAPHSLKIPGKTSLIELINACPKENLQRLAS